MRLVLSFGEVSHCFIYFPCSYFPTDGCLLLSPKAASGVFYVPDDSLLLFALKTDFVLLYGASFFRHVDEVMEVCFYAYSETSAPLCLFFSLSLQETEQLTASVAPELELRLFIVGLKSTIHLSARQHYFHLCRQHISLNMSFSYCSLSLLLFNVLNNLSQEHLLSIWTDQESMHTPYSLTFCLLFLVTSAKACVLLCHNNEQSIL